MENSFPSLLFIMGFCRMFTNISTVRLYPLKLTVNVISSSAIFLFQLWYSLCSANIFFLLLREKKKTKKKERNRNNDTTVETMEMNLTGTFSFCFSICESRGYLFEQSDGTSIFVIHKQILAVLFFGGLTLKGQTALFAFISFFIARLFVANNVFCYFSLANGIFITNSPAEQSNRFTFQIKFRRKRFIE